MKRVVVILCFAFACGGDDGGGEAAEVIDTSETDSNEGLPCDDGDPCTKDDSFHEGVCTGVPYECKGSSLFCVLSQCDGHGGCIESVKDGFCFIDGACFSAEQKNPKNVCESCSPNVSQKTWAPIEEATLCSDGNACTSNDHCDKGICTGTPVDCDDKNDCTEDSCDEKLGCIHKDLSGDCNDGNVCTIGDKCLAGKCQPGTTLVDCEDGDECTVDTCDPVLGCVNTLNPEVACDDNNPCTAEWCDTTTHKCKYDLSTLDNHPCEDGNLCSGKDLCQNGECVPGPEPTNCDDNNPCTADACITEIGCVHSILFGPCDDGFDCTINDACIAGKCSGKKTLDCGICVVSPNPDANKIVLLQLGSSGHPGEGLDLDANPLTCAPQGNCSGGIDNELGAIASFVNPGLAQSVVNGYLMYVLEFVNFNTSGNFTLNFMDATLAETNPTCDYQVAQCQYVPLQESLDPLCNSIVTFDNARIEGTKLTAGGPTYTFALQATLVGGATMMIGITHARIEATAEFNKEGHIQRLTGMIGGGVSKMELMDTVSKLPDYVFPMKKDQVLTLLDTLILNDLDIDGDGNGDVVSVNIRFESIPADIVPGP